MKNSNPEWLSELTYNKRTGVLKRKGVMIGHYHSAGYLVYDDPETGKQYRVHRLIVRVVTGAWPQHNVDHINGVKDDNRWRNLRDVPQLINAQNLRTLQRDNTSGYMGVSWYKREQKWRAQIRVEGVKKSLGYYDSPEAAHAVFMQAKRSMHEGNTL